MAFATLAFDPPGFASFGAAACMSLFAAVARAGRPVGGASRFRIGGLMRICFSTALGFLMYCSTRSRAVSSGICTGGDFLKYADGAMSAPFSPWSRPSLAQRTASMTMPAELGESQTSSFISRFSGTSPNVVPSMRIWHHLRSFSHGT